MLIEVLIVVCIFFKLVIEKKFFFFFFYSAVSLLAVLIRYLQYKTNRCIPTIWKTNITVCTRTKHKPLMYCVVTAY